MNEIQLALTGLTLFVSGFIIGRLITAVQYAFSKSIKPKKPEPPKNPTNERKEVKGQLEKHESPVKTSWYSSNTHPLS